MKLIRTLPIIWSSVCFLGIAFGDQSNSPLHGVGISIAAGTQSSTNLQKDKIGGDFPTIAYGIQQFSDRLLIQPKLLFLNLRPSGARVYDDYFAILRSGKPIYPFSDPAYGFNVSFPELDVRMVNNSGQRLFFSKAFINVSRSTPNDEPLLMLPDHMNVNGPDLLCFDITNDGWGAIDNLKVEFNLTREQPDQLDTRYKYAKEYGRFTDTLRVRLYDEFLGEGVSQRLVSLVKQACQSSSDNYSAALDKLTPKDFGPFAKVDKYRNPAVSAYASGRISYSWKDSVGASYSRTILFWTDISLQQGAGGGPEANAGEYEAMLRSKGENYSIVVPISQTLKAGDVTRFFVRIGIPRTSNHDLQIRFQTTEGGYVDSPQITLNGLLPKSAINMLRETHPNFPRKSS